jgi:hypothetical protein
VVAAAKYNRDLVVHGQVPVRAALLALPAIPVEDGANQAGVEAFAGYARLGHLGALIGEELRMGGRDLVQVLTYVA